MSRNYPLICKGKAMALNLTVEYKIGYNNPNETNPYDYFDQYIKHYAFDIGQQKRRNTMKG